MRDPLVTPRVNLLNLFQISTLQIFLILRVKSQIPFGNKAGMSNYEVALACKHRLF